jgi:hypothetical protein
LQESKKKYPLAKIPTAVATTERYILRLLTGFWLMTNAMVFDAKAWEWNKDSLTIMEM